MRAWRTASRRAVAAPLCALLLVSCGDDGPPGPADRSAEVGACLGPDTGPDVPGYGVASAFQRLEQLEQPDFSDLDVVERWPVEGRDGEMLRLAAFPGLAPERANGQAGWTLNEIVVDRLAAEAAAGTALYVRVWLDDAAARESLGEGVPFVVGRRADGSTVLIGDCAASMAERLAEPLLDRFGDELELEDDLVVLFQRVGDPDDPAHDRYLELTNEHRFDRAGEG